MSCLPDDSVIGLLPHAHVSTAGYVSFIALVHNWPGRDRQQHAPQVHVCGVCDCDIIILLSYFCVVPFIVESRFRQLDV